MSYDMRISPSSETNHLPLVQEETGKSDKDPALMAIKNVKEVLSTADSLTLTEHEFSTYGNYKLNAKNQL